MSHRSTIAIVCSLLACGGQQDNAIDASLPSELDAGTIDGQPACNQLSVNVSDGSVIVLSTLVCPVSWHCDVLNPHGDYGPFGKTTCCPADAKCSPYPCSPLCVTCDCVQTCCPAGMMCDWGGKSPVFCDGG
jgi:hypothetical protein